MKNQNKKKRCKTALKNKNTSGGITRKEHSLIYTGRKFTNISFKQ